MIKSKTTILPVYYLLVAVSCSRKDTVSPLISPSAADTTTLKQAASFPIGVAISYDLMKNNANYSSLVKKQFDRVTFEY